MDIARVTAVWTGFNGAPGYSNFFFAVGGGVVSDRQQVADRVAGAFNSARTALASSVEINIQSEVAILSSETGVIQSFDAITPPAPVSGNGPGAYSGPTGACVNWRTSDVRNGRRIRGRTFLVPLSGSAYDTTGTLATSTLTSVRAFADAITGTDFDSEFGVWARPINGSGGVFASVDSYSVPDKAAVLRSRRD
uniref:Uncharacterized protein n=1 Tax=uncultured prokaryote TaxID=198431 RepID=A0A0H5Q3Q3_9ZZZZ|nr:hypothetical protein [uncultured prokaryote]